MKKKQNERLRKLEKMKKSGDTVFMKNKIEEWKRKGYNTLPLEYRMKGLGAQEMRRIMDKWKSKYKTEGYKNKK